MPWLSVAVALAALAAPAGSAPAPPPSLNAPMSDHAAADAAEFFMGSKPRPKLEIVQPANGAVLLKNSVDVRVRVTGDYAFPSPLHDAKVRAFGRAAVLSLPRTFSKVGFSLRGTARYPHG
jgi:hypothetical protein